MRMAAARPGELHDDALSAIRYVVNFAKLLVVRDVAGVDHDVQGFMASHAWKVKDALTPHLITEPSLWGAMRVLPERSTRTARLV